MSDRPTAESLKHQFAALTVAQVVRSDLDGLRAYFAALKESPITPETVDDWVAACSLLEATVAEAGSSLFVAYTQNTGDSEAEAAHLRFTNEIAPEIDALQVELSGLLIDSGLAPTGLDLIMRGFATERALFRPANMSRLAELDTLSAEYQKVVGSLSVDWDGTLTPLPALAPHLQSADRATRERAFRLSAEAQSAVTDQMDDIFDRMYALRQAVAQEAGFQNFRDYAMVDEQRFDYGVAECERFHQAAAGVAAPAVARMHERRRLALGVETLRPWDLDAPRGTEQALVPFTDVAELTDRAVALFDRLDPELGAAFRGLVEDDLLDLGCRADKAPGGYCLTYVRSGRPFIFMNAVGVPSDVVTLVHEAGHAFHSVLTEGIPLHWQRDTGHEASELASMSMELLATPYLSGENGFYPESSVRQAHREHLEDILFYLPYIACVDEFQHWLYTSGMGGDRQARNAAWMRLREKYEQGVDWSGLDAERAMRWHRQLHIFEYPFYYIEYAIAQLGALQIWYASQADAPSALERYKSALRLGGRATLPEIYAEAGVRLVFDEADLAPLVAQVESEIASLTTNA